MKIRTNKQIEILQTEAKNIADKLKKEVVAIVKGKGVQYIQVQAGVSYQLNFKDFDVEKLNLIAKKVDDDLEIMLEDSIIIFDNYFSVCIADLPCLVSLPFDNAKLYHIVSDIFFTLEDGTQIVYFYGKQSITFAKSDTVNTTSYQGFYDTVISNTVNVITLLSVIIARNSDNNSDDTNSDDTNTVITGTFSAGKYIKGSKGDSVKIYKADGTGALINSSSLDENGQYTITLTGIDVDYTGAVYVKLIKSGVYHKDELKGPKELDSDLFAVAYIRSGENIIDISVRSSVAAKILNVDKGTTTIELSETDIDKWNKKVNASFNLLGSAINTDIDTINSLDDESDTQALRAGQVAAALSGMRNIVTNTFEKVIEKVAEVIANTGALDKTTLEALAVGSNAVKEKAEADKIVTATAVNEATKVLRIAEKAVIDATDTVTNAQKQAVINAQKAYDQAVSADQKTKIFIDNAFDAFNYFNNLQITISNITITDDTGIADFITNDNTLVISATLDNALSAGKKLWGSIDGGKTWTDISATGTDIIWSNNNKTVAWAQKFTEDINSSIQFVITKTITATTATTTEIMNDKDGGIARHDYLYDSTAPTKAMLAIKSGENNLIGANKTAYLEVTYSNMATGDAIQLQKDDGNKTNLGAIYNVTSLDVDNNKATIAIKQTDLSTLSTGSISVSIKTITDLAGNVNNVASTNQIFKVDVVAPTIIVFSAIPGFYKEGEKIDLTATVSESIKADAKITIILNTGATVELIAVTEGTTLTGTLQSRHLRTLIILALTVLPLTILCHQQILLAIS